MVASNETVLKAHTTYISKQLYAIVCGEGVCKTIDLTTYIGFLSFLNEYSCIFAHVLNFYNNSPKIFIKRYQIP